MDTNSEERGRIWRALGAPVFASDEDLTRRAWLLNITLLASFVAVLLPFPGEGLIRLSFAAAVVPTKILLNRGRVDLAGYGLAVLMFALTTVLAAQHGGIGAPHVGGYLLMVFGTGLILGTPVAFATAAAGLVAGLGLTLQAGGTSSWTAFSILAAMLGVAMALVAAARSALERSLERLRRELVERTEGERSLHSVHAELRLALDAGRMGTWSWNAETGAISWSPEVHRITNGLTQAFTGGLREFLSFVHIEDRDAFDRAVAEALASSRDPRRFEARLVLPGAEERWYELRGQALEQQSGPVGVVGTIADIDDRRRVEEERERLVAELAARNSELERFTYTVSHDLKSPLITIRGFLGFLEEDALAGRVDRVRDDTARIVDATAKMLRLLEELLDLSRVGRQGEAPAKFSGEEAAAEAVALVAGRIDASGARVEVMPGLPTLYGDRTRIVQVFQNLIDNAASFMGGQPSPRIVIAGRSDRAWPVITVRDNGIGIASEYRERIFGLFEKLDPRSGGTGVGLALVKRIVEHHGGEVWAESEGEGMGSAFCFTLPPPPVRAV